MVPVPFRIVNQNSQIKLDTDSETRILRALAWQEKPPFAHPGRTAWLPLAASGSSTRLFGLPPVAAKLKGVGLWNPKTWRRKSEVRFTEYSDVPHPPIASEYVYTAQQFHLGFSTDISFCTLQSEQSPVGGILLRRAMQEFNHGVRLYDQGVPVTVPYLLVQYTNIPLFNGEPLGAVVSLSVEASSLRVNVVHNADNDLTAEENRYLAKLKKTLDLDNFINEAEWKSQAVYRLGFHIGARLRQFCSCGLYRHSGGWDNYIFSNKLKTVLLTDLDSSRRLEELSDCEKKLYILRDVGSTVFKLLNRLYHPIGINLFTLNSLYSFNPISSILNGFFERTEDAALSSIAEELMSFYVIYFDSFKRHRAEAQEPLPSAVRRSFKMSQDIFLSLFILKMWDKFCEANVVETVGKEIPRSILANNAEEYLGERFKIIARWI